MGRTFDEWWNSIPKDLRDKLRTVPPHELKVKHLKNIGPLLDNIKRAGNESLLPSHDELKTWGNLKDLFEANQLKFIDHTVAHKILEHKGQIEDLLGT